MLVGIPAETAQNERRIAATPETVKKMTGKGLSVSVLSGAGTASGLSDSEFEAAGAQIVSDASSLLSQADVILAVQGPELSSVKAGALLISFFQPLTQHDYVKQLAQKKISALSMEMIPRIARAQKLDALSSQANVAGYKAVMMAADTYGKMFPMLMTAAGTVFPAKVLVIGAGVAGLQAIATAYRLGGVVEAYDTRPAVREQVESLGGKFLQIELSAGETETKGGYAKELSQEDQRKLKEMLAQHIKQSDVVISTAAIPGKPSPKIIEAEMVRQMKPGSVIVDLAAEGGGNCVLTKPGEVIEENGVTVIGRLNVPSLMAAQSSQLYARNVAELLFEILKEGKIELNAEDEVVKGALVTHQGEVVHDAVKERVK